MHQIIIADTRGNKIFENLMSKYPNLKDAFDESWTNSMGTYTTTFYPARFTYKLKSQFNTEFESVINELNNELNDLFNVGIIGSGYIILSKHM